MKCCKEIDKKQLFNLLSGMLGIYVLYFIAGILNQSLIKRPQYNRFTHNYDICTNAIGLLLVPFAVTWVIGAIYNKVQFESATQIPVKNSIMTAGTVVAGALFSILAIQSTSFTVVIMFESCSILPVVFIGVFCSRVHDPNLKLGPKKIITAFVIAGGILMFQFADPETKNREAKQNILGIVFLLFHFVAQGFLPDLQAEIKINYKPRPTQMMTQINKYCTLITFALSILLWELWDFALFIWAHPLFSFDLIIMSIFGTFGQFFVYRMIKQFKQHFVPFTISSRKILTVAISIVFYGHQTNWIQILGICIVLLTIFIDFVTEISKKSQTQESENNGQFQLNQQNFGEDKKQGSQSQGSLSKNSQNQHNSEDFKSFKQTPEDKNGEDKQNKDSFTDAQSTENDGKNSILGSEPRINESDNYHSCVDQVSEQKQRKDQSGDESKQYKSFYEPKEENK